MIYVLTDVHIPGEPVEDPASGSHVKESHGTRRDTLDHLPMNVERTSE